MKQSTNFPYDVDIHTIDLKELSPTPDTFEYEAILPEYYSKDSKYAPILSNIDLIAEVNCSATMFRKVYPISSSKTLSISIPKQKVNVKFGLDLLLVANKEFLWDSQNIKKGMPIAHFGTFSKNIDNRSSGLISFESSDEEKISISNSDHTIKVKIPDKQFDYLMRTQHSLLTKKVLTSQFAQIALLECCKELKCNSKRDNLIWYQELLSRWYKYSKQKDDFPQEIDHLRFVQYLLKNPSVSLIDHLISERSKD